MEVALVSFFYLLDNLELPKKKKPQLKNPLIRWAVNMSKDIILTAN